MSCSNCCYGTKSSVRKKMNEKNINQPITKIQEKKCNKSSK